MQFDAPLLKLPIRFCADRLASEVRALPAEAWQPHPQAFEGNEYVPLVSPSGQITNEFAGPMCATEYLLECPYMMESMAAIGAVWGRGRLMGLGIGGAVPVHIDANYYWRTHIRIHVPIITNPLVDFTCGGETVHMAAGECWVFDTFREHHVENNGSEQRIHLVLDTVGGERLWDLMEEARQGEGTSQFIEPGQVAVNELLFEKLNYPKVMSPWELQSHIGELIGQAVDTPNLEPVERRLDRLVAGWSAAWALFADRHEGLPAYRRLIETAQEDLVELGAQTIKLNNDRLLFRVLKVFVFENAIVNERVRQSMADAAAAESRIAS
jgi:hypothetical protein